MRLRERVDIQSEVDRLEHAPGIRKVIRVFPDEEDAELARMLMVEAEPEQGEAVLGDLEQDAAVEYVESTAPRRLIR
ncbi:MAG: hypothetical protein ACOZNI_19850 [Myxococcota bacterium]